MGRSSRALLTFSWLKTRILRTNLIGFGKLVTDCMWKGEKLHLVLCTLWMHSSDLVPLVMSMGWSNLRTVWKFGFIGIFDIDYEQSTSNQFELVTKELFDPHRVLWQTSHTDQFIWRNIWQVVSNNIRGIMCFSQSVCTLLALNPYKIIGQKCSVLEIISTASILLAKF